MLPRCQWFEFNELPWMPDALKHAITRSITFDQWFQGCFRGELPRRFARWLHRTNASTVVDIGSGSGGPVLTLVHALRKQGIDPPNFRLTDLYPDTHRLADISRRSPAWANGDTGYVSFSHEPVDALADPIAPGYDYFTLINIAHHFPPKLLTRILANIVRQGRGVFVIDTYYRSPRFFSLMLASLLPSWVAPLFVRPFRLSHFLFGTLIPIVPFLVMHDGLATILRSYNPHEWHALIDSLPPNDYEWEIDRMPTGTVYIAGRKR